MNKSACFRLNPLVLSIASVFALAQSTDAQGACVTNGSTTDCEGAIASGVVLESSAGALNLTVNSGSAAENAEIGPTAVPGIRVSSSGTPSAPSNDALLNVPIPGEGVSGGEVTVNSYSTITTTGAAAHGIAAGSNTSGYPSAVKTALESFSDAGISFVVSSVKKPDGTEAVIGTAVSAKVAVIEELSGGLKQFNGFSGEAGTFTIAADGTVSFDMGSDFNDLANGESRVVAVDIAVDGYRSNVLKRSGEAGQVVAEVTRNASGVLEVTRWANFETFGESDKPQTSNLAWPDLNAYVGGLVVKAEGAGGAGNSVTVNHRAGTITTGGSAAYGIHAESSGRNGGAGRNAGGFFTFGAISPTQGGIGNQGGDVIVRVDGAVNTTHEGAVDHPEQASLGVFAHSQAGDGGRGGNGSTWYGGRRGGTGGIGGLVEVFGSGTVTTMGHNAIGIYALNEGGDGGNGGEGSFVNPAEKGGFGGKGGEVYVEGTWDITTGRAATDTVARSGDNAYGIWAKSVGGTAGSGGSGGWLAGASAGGGEGATGSKVTLISGGRVETFGNDAFGLFGQSVGGFGGSGGVGGSIFKARGGNGESAGAGGDVSVTNQSSGEVITHGKGSHAVFSQSVGGGGGAGGGGSGVVGYGGGGGYGGTGGIVNLTNAGTVKTTGENARGLFAQSVGGGGGDGGDSAGVVAIGGGGSGTSDGGDVTLTNSGTVTTKGVGANAVFAQSIGGGGGTGGSSTGWFSIGGGGGGGGNAGEVKVTNSGELVETDKENATAIYAQSIGGGGGKGGAAISAGAFTSMSIGGNGAAGGTGDTVDVESLAGDILTKGNRSYGIFAQSIGGGGGDGGYAVSGSVGVGASITIGVGGEGGGGGNSDAVTVTNYSRIKTEGEDADGIFAESIGGGGGTGGFSISGAASDGLAITLNFGGKGGGGGDGKAVSVFNFGLIETIKERSVGLQAQSVGGGGGRGGFSITGSGAGLGAFALGVGGFGGSGGDASLVHVENSGEIDTQGTNSHGLLAQSVGGGGGNGGFNIIAAGAGTGTATIGIGGGGGTAGNAEAVEVSNEGKISTDGKSAVALFAQSVGGGGGNGGFSVTGAAAGTGAGVLNVGGSGAGGGAAKKVTVGNKGNLHTLDEDAHGLVAQSVGGGGGNGGFAIGFTAAGTAAGTANIGGFGAGGGNGNWVDVINEGAIDTKGDRSVALFAQSVGGGGGNGGFSIAGAGAGTGAGTLSLGGYAAGGGDADIVTVDNKARLVTQGGASYGLLAQSVGGGGGNGGFSISVAGAGNGAGALSFGGSGGSGGDGKAVTVTNSGAVFTYGANSSGMFAQSVGGGGGSGGFSVAGSGAKTGAVSLSMGGSGGGGGDGAIVGLTNHGLITTYGGLSYGIIAQSVGGGGGAGGFSFAAGLTTNGFSINGSLGGSGGTGGSAEVVTLANHGGVTTSGEGSHGLVAQSVGGGGGSGGFSGSLTVGLGSKPDISVSVGGSGDVGGDAKTVGLSNDAALTTRGKAAYGMFAQSVGGGGGHGGGSLGVVLGLHDGGANLAVAIGGSGDGGGTAEKVTLGNSGTIITSGEKAHAIVAQSVGGGGGNGGFSASGVVAKGTNAKDLSVSVGGSAGEGGNAGEIDLTNSGRIFTTGKGAAGIIAQSLGGGGGNGGFSFSGAFGGTQAKSLAISVGGSGGKGGVGKTVKVINTGAIDTGWTEAATVLSNLFEVGAAVSSDDELPQLPDPPTSPEVPDTPDALLIERYAIYTAYGIFAQSIGGGGGSGGTSVSVGTGFGGTKDTWNVNAAVAVGGSGGDGNVGGKVDVTNKAMVTTRENDSHALFAQSVGGGGGVGGGSITATIGLGAANTGRSYNGNLSIGGDGGTGNIGGEVLLDNQGNLRTFGDLADGIRAQSIGGGGGSGGSSRTVNFLLKAGSATLEKDQTAGNNFKTQVSVGGSGGSGNHGGAVDVANSAEIVTSGITSRGIFAQSIGGGGGSGGDGILGTGTAAGSFLSVANLRLGTMGGSGKGITKFLQGQLRNLSVAVGGDEGSSGHGGAVAVSNSGAITTYGFASTAIEAQSVGGGGGEVNAFASGEESGGKAAAGALGKVGIGGAAGASGNGGVVAVSNTAELNTFGDAAYGVFAQSVGGGGGVAGNVDRAGSSFITHGVGIGLDFARDGGSAGNGGSVTVSGGGNITTRGGDAYGIMAQSIGGGGGVASGLSTNPVNFLTELIGLAGSVGGHGSGGTVAVTHNGDITTLGYAAHGIFAQSAGGKTDPDDPEYLGVGGNVTVSLAGNLRVNGADGDGILAQSVGDAGAGNISVTVDSGSVQGGSGSGAGVRFLDGSANTLTNRGTISALSNSAIVGGASAESIENYGTITGNVDLGVGANAFNNRADASFMSGESAIVGNGRLLANAGTLSPGGRNQVQSTALTGNLQQTSGGILAMDVSLASVAHDILTVSGAAQMAGGLQVNPVVTGYAKPGSFRRVMLTADDGISDDGLQIAASPSGVVNYRLTQLNVHEMAVDFAVDFAPRQLGANGQRFGRYINALQSAGGSAAFAPFASALVAQEGVAELDSAYEKLGPGTTGNSSSSSSSASMTLSDAMHSCRQREGENRFLREGECNWVRIGGGVSDQEGSGSSYGYDLDTFTLAGGSQHEVARDLFAGFGASYQRVNLNARYSGSDGDQFDVSAIVKKQVEATKYEVSAGVGYGRFDSRRYIDLTGSPLVADSHQHAWSFAVHGRISHDLMQGSDAYIRPMVDLGVTHVVRNSFAESGAGGANLEVDEEADTFVTLQPMIEVGGERKLDDGTLLRPYARFGVTQFLTDNDRSVTARLSGAPSSVASFTVVNELDRTYADVSIGLDVMKKNGMVVRVDYTGQFSENTSTNAFGVKFSMPF